MRSRILRSTVAGLAVVAAAALAACGGGGGGGGADDPNVTAIPEGASEFVVSMQDNLFVPENFSIKAGQTVTIVAKNEGTAIHNLSVLNSNFKSDALVQPGQESRFEVTFSRAGKFKFQCDYHLPEMVGEITVR